MRFVKNFTPPDFQAKNFTPLISPKFNRKWRNLHCWQKFYIAAGSDGMDKFHLCLQMANFPTDNYSTRSIRYTRSFFSGRTYQGGPSKKTPCTWRRQKSKLNSKTINKKLKPTWTTRWRLIDKEWQDRDFTQLASHLTEFQKCFQIQHLSQSAANVLAKKSFNSFM